MHRRRRSCMLNRQGQQGNLFNANVSHLTYRDNQSFYAWLKTSLDYLSTGSFGVTFQLAPSQGGMSLNANEEAQFPKPPRLRIYLLCLSWSSSTAVSPGWCTTGWRGWLSTTVIAPFVFQIIISALTTATLRLVEA